MPNVSVTTANGLVVVTQVFQQGEDIKIPLNTIATPAAPATANAVESVEPSPPVSPMTKRFLQGQPKYLGIVQIFIGLVTLALGIMLLWNRFSMWGAPLWSGPVFVLSGTIAVIAQRQTQPCLVNSTMALNALSCAVATAAAVIYAVSLATHQQSDSGCVRVDSDYRYDDKDYYWMCQEIFWKYWTVINGVRGLLLVLSVFELAVAFSSVVFAGQASCSSSVAEPTVLVIESVCPSGTDGSKEALLGSKETPQSPPPYDA